jgi:xanthine dehydrogenase YagS FAD-binding subunit
METATAAAEAAVSTARPLSMNGYKVPLTVTVVKRALMAAAGNRYWEGG